MASDVLVEMLLGGQYQDVTNDAYTRNPIQISRGGGPIAEGVDPASLSLTINNRDGAYSPRNPRSPWFGTFGRNTPIRVSVPLGESYLALDGSLTGNASTPDTVAFDFTNSLDVRIEATTGWHTQDQATTLIGQFEEDPGDGWVLRSDPGGIVNLFIFTTDGNSGVAAALPPDLPGRAAVRATWVADNGTGVSEATVYWAESLDGPWTLAGNHVDDTAATALATAHPLEIAPEYVNAAGDPRVPMAGRVHRAELRAVIDGAVVAGPDFRGLAPGTTGFTGSAGLVWSLNGTATVTDRSYRFVGEVAEFPTRWATGGQDVWTELQAAGILRRLGQGAAPLKSTLRRRIPSGNPLAYWPLEEGRNATQAYSPIEGVQPLRLSGMNLASDSTLPGSDALPALTDNASMSGAVPPGTGTGEWHIELVYKIEEGPADNDTTLLQWFESGGPYVRYRVAVGMFDPTTPQLRFLGYDSDDNETLLLNATNVRFFGDWARLQVFAHSPGGSPEIKLRVIQIGMNDVTYTEPVSSAPGHVVGIRTPFGAQLDGASLGHVSVFEQADVLTYNSADHGFTGESAQDRIQRLAAETGLPLIATGDPADSLPLGPQRIATLLDNVQDAADVDGGLLYEQRETLGLAYVGRDLLYNPTPGLTLDYTVSGEVMPPLEPTDDDQALRNDRTVQRDGGSSARAVLAEGSLSVLPPPDGAGVYDDSVTLNAASDEQLSGLAHWRLHLGTVDEARYPSVSINLRTAPHLITDVLSLDVGSTIRIVNLPSWLPPGPVDLRVEGYTETLKPLGWEISFNCSPGSPWVVGYVAEEAGADGTDQPNRADTSGSVLAADVDSVSTELLVHTVDGLVWVTSAGAAVNHPADFPFDVNAGGEVVRASGIEPMVWDGFTRTVVDGWGTAESGTAWAVTGGAGPPDFDVNGSEGTITLPADQGLLRFGEIEQVLGDAETLVSIAVDTLPAVGDYLAGLFFRAGTVGGSTVLYWVDLALQADGQVGIEVRNVVTPVGARVVTPLTFAPGTRLWLRARVDGHRVRGRVWPDGENDPGGWNIDRTITTDTIDTGTIGVTVASTDGINTTPTFSVDNYTVVTPQRFTVTRSINGLTKAHLAGANVALAQPAIAAL